MARTRVKGLDRLNRQLGRLPELARELARRQLAAEAEATAAAVARAAPDERLRRSVDWSEGPPPKTAVLGRAQGANGRRAALIGAGLLFSVYAGNKEAFWARWSEFGTAPHSLAKGAVRKRGRKQSTGAMHPGARAQPFFWPNVRARKRAAKAAMARAAREAAKALASV